MKPNERTLVNVNTLVKLSAAKVWELWTNPWHIIHLNQASAEWHTSKAENDVKKNGRFSYRMEARDGSVGFDFSGEYRKVTKHKYIECFLDDSRTETKKLFEALAEGGKVEQELQDMFWGDCYGSCKDKYGVQWMFACSSKA